MQNTFTWDGGPDFTHIPASPACEALMLNKAATEVAKAILIKII